MLGTTINVDVPQSTIFPILLDKEVALTQLIVIDCLKRVEHGGVNNTSTEMRSSYWVIQGRQLVKKLLHNCVVCRRFQCKPYKAPSPPLPLLRVREAPPFSYTGIHEKP